MKTGVLLFLFGILIILSMNGLYPESATGSAVTGKAITGNATSANIAVSVTVVGLPALAILVPKNSTYFASQGIRLNFSASNADSVWYNLDNGTNITITANTSFDTNLGSHTLYLFSNNSYGSSSKNVTFSMNTTKFRIKYDQYKGNGSSKDFNESSYEDIKNLSDVSLEKTGRGKILFNEALNLTDDKNPEDDELDIDSHINISSNFIGINTTALPNFNKSATLSLYDLTFANPRILRNGEPCSAAICTKIEYSGGVLVFNVTSFSNYSSEEISAGSDNSGASSSGGSSGGSVATTTLQKKALSIEKNQISVSLTPGEIKTEKVTIKNNKKQQINVEIKNLLANFVILRDSSFSLNPDEEKTISADFVAREDVSPDLYLGKLIFEANGESQEILLAVQVKSSGVLLDVNVEIPKNYREVLPGAEVLSNIKLFNLGGSAGREDVTIKYSVRDFNGNTIYEGTESLAVETQTSFVKKIPVDKDAKIGDYVLYVRAVYDNKVASATDTFRIVSRIVTEREKIYIVAIIILAVALSLFIYLRINHQRKVHGKKFGKKRFERVDLSKIIRK